MEETIAKFSGRKDKRTDTRCIRSHYYSTYLANARTPIEFMIHGSLGQEIPPHYINVYHTNMKATANWIQKPLHQVKDVSVNVAQTTKKVVAKSVEQVQQRLPTFGIAQQDRNHDREKARASLAASSQRSDNIPSDEVLDRMKRVLQGATLEISTTADFFERFWKSDFYPTFLSETGAQNIEMTPWKNGEWINNWDQQQYSQKSTVSMEMQQSSPLFSGTVYITQSLFHESNEDRVIIAVSNETRGIPFADSFSVQIRWVVSKVPSNHQQLHAQVGLFVWFTKSCFVSGTIRSVASQETKDSQILLLRKMLKDLGQGPAVPEGEMEEAPVVAGPQDANPWESFLNMIQKIFPHAQDDDNDIQRLLRYICKKWHRVENLSGVPDTNDIKDEFDLVRETLNEIIQRRMNLNDEVLKASLNRQQANSATHEQSPLDILSPAKKIVNQFWKTAKTFKPRKNLLKVAVQKSQRKLDSKDQPDNMMSGMNMILSKTIQGVSLEVVRHSFVVAEQKRKEWMEQAGFFEIESTSWKKAKESPFIEPWSGEMFDYQRSFSFKRKTSVLSLSSSLTSTVVHEKTTEFYRLESKGERLILAQRTKLEGVSFGKAYEVHIRYVFTRLEDHQLDIKVGLYVLFTESILLESQIRVSVTREFKKRTMAAFRRVNDTVAGFQELDRVVDEKALSRVINEQQGSHLSTCLQSFPGLGASSLRWKNDPQWTEIFDKIRQRLDMVQDGMAKSGDMEEMEDLNFYASQLEIVEVSLDNILRWHKDSSLSQH